MKVSLRHLAVGLGLLLLSPVTTAQAQAPSLSPIPNITVNAGTTLTVNVVAVEPGGLPITLTHALPAFATLNAPMIGNGQVVTTMTLSPLNVHIGGYSTAVTATAGGVSDTEIFQITVNPAGSNQAPQVGAPAIQEVTEGANLAFSVTVTDPDGDEIQALAASGAPGGSTFTPNGTNTSGAFSWTPGSGDAGEYDVLFTATPVTGPSAGAATHIHVGAPPGLAIDPIDDVTVADGSFISVAVHATGLPGETITLTASLPSFAMLNTPGSGTGSVSTTISVSPPTGSAGTYHASVTATSGGESVTEAFDIIVTGTGPGENHAPVLTAPASATVEIGFNLTFDVTASDPDGDHVDLFGSALPPGSAFLDNADNTGTFSWTPVAGQAGTHTASFSGTDGRGGSGAASTVITVTGGEPPQNLPPVVTAPTTKQVDEGVNLSFTVSASDPDGDHVTLTAGSVPSGAAFLDQGDNTGLFSWTPGSTQSGVYVVNFDGNDGRGGTGTASTTITVMDVTPGGEEPTEVAGKACLIGKNHNNVHKNNTCVRIGPVNHSFDLRDLDLSSITLHYHGASLEALGAEVDVKCRGNGNDDAASIRMNGGNPHGEAEDREDDDEGQDGCGIFCRGHDFEDGDGGHGHAGCDTLGIRACFSTQALQALFGRTPMSCAFVDVEIHAMLMNGDHVVARFGADRLAHVDEDRKDEGEGKQGEGEDKKGNQDNQGNQDQRKDGEDRNDEGDRNDHGGRIVMLNPKVRPNPLNPKTELSFTTSRAGRVRVAIYDMQGRLVKTLLDEDRADGEQRLTWDGSNERSQKVSSGVYYFQILTPEGQVVKSVAVVK